MFISHETPEQTQRRLQRVAAAARIEFLEGEWWYEAFPLNDLATRRRPDAVALVRDQDCWSQLVPVRVGDHPLESFRLWRFHFPGEVDNSGFVGWLATRIKERAGSGIFVVCGYDSRHGGIYDYWGCPAAAAVAVLTEIRALTTTLRVGRAEEGDVESLDGIRMRVVSTASGGEVSSETLFTFGQEGAVVSAHYVGGTVRLGYLVGNLTQGHLRFRYAQVDGEGRVDGGHSICDLQRLPDGRIRLLEHFERESRDGSGTNVLEEVE